MRSGGLVLLLCGLAACSANRNDDPGANAAANTSIPTQLVTLSVDSPTQEVDVQCTEVFSCDYALTIKMADQSLQDTLDAWLADWNEQNQAENPNAVTVVQSTYNVDVLVDGAYADPETLQPTDGNVPYFLPLNDGFYKTLETRGVFTAGGAPPHALLTFYVNRQTNPLDGFPMPDSIDYLVTASTH
jgi:hypothetical protein